MQFIMSRFAFITGQFMGHLSNIMDDREGSKELEDKGFSLEDQKILFSHLKKLAQVFYVD